MFEDLENDDPTRINFESSLSGHTLAHASAHALAAAGLRHIPTPADWAELAKNLPLLQLVLAGRPMCDGGQRQARMSLVGSILHRRPTWASSAIAEAFRESLSPAGGDLHVAEGLLEEIRGWCDEFERGAGKGFKSDELRAFARVCARKGETDTALALEGLLDAEGGRAALLPLEAAQGELVGRALARYFAKRALRALYDTLYERLHDLRHPFAEAAVKAWTAQRGEHPALVTLERNTQGVPARTEGNARAALAELALPFAYDVRRARYTIRGPVPWDVHPNDRAVTDSDAGALCMHMAMRYGLHVPSTIWASALQDYASQFPYDNVQEYLLSLPKWDGVYRWPTLMQRAAKSTEDFVGTLMTRWAVGAVARVLQPGCKNDTMLTLVGPQGYRKTSFVRALVPQSDNFRESFRMRPGDKDALMQVHSGGWLVEHGELAGLRTSQVEEVKAFLSTAEDSYRAPYARFTQTYPRRSVLVGTTNDNGTGLLRDTTGSRRFWIVPVEAEIDTALVERERDQLWAEALSHYHVGFEWWLTPDEQRELERVSEPHQAHDSIQDDIMAYVAKRSEGLEGKHQDVFVTVKEIHALLGGLGAPNRGEQMRIAQQCKALGANHVKRQMGKIRSHGFAFPPIL